jgi:hypothetical protein
MDAAAGTWEEGVRLARRTGTTLPGTALPGYC